MSEHVFISHSSRDDAFVRELREALEGFGVEVWVDSRDMAGGAKLTPEVQGAIERARGFVAVISPHAVNSSWVRVEIQKALEVERAREGDGYRVVPLLLPGIEPSALPLWFGEEPTGVRVEVGAGGLAEAMPHVLAALGERAPDDPAPAQPPAQKPLEELTLRLEYLKIDAADGKRRARAVAQLTYEPANSAPAVESKRFAFTAPLGLIEAEELRWYLEEYYVWPIGIFQERAARVEARLPEWGQALYGAALAPEAAREAFDAWRRAGEDGERRFSVFVERELPVGSSEGEQAEADEAAAELLALPWELLHDGRGFLFHGASGVRVRRRLPNRRRQKVRPTGLPIRILLVSPRPEDGRTPYIDHRISARPLVEAVEGLGDLAKLSILTPPTFPSLVEALREADERGEPFDVVHFDGHGVYDRRVGLGGLCFEDPKDADEPGRRAVDLIHAERVAEVMRDRRIPLVFLEACQTAKTEEDPTASVAAKLLEEGVTSVVAMSHTVLVETARRFVKAFYRELAGGSRVGTAMTAGQRELRDDDYRGRLMGAGELRLQDWFVPVLYQEKQDPRLVNRLPASDVLRLQEARRRISLGRLPPPPPHDFQGRSRELLVLERLLARAPYAVVRGRGGEGKTTLAAELARWLVRTGRHERAAFVSLEQYADARGVLINVGQQLLPEGDGWHVPLDQDLKAALRPVERALRDRPTVIVLDNVESVLPDREGRQPPGAAPVSELFDLCRRLLDADPATRLVFTTREPLPSPFDSRRNEMPLGALSREDAVALVGEVMKQEGLTPRADDPGSDPREVTDLVEAVDRHARALVLLARELAHTGVRATTENLRRLTADLDRRHPGERENSLYASVELSLRRLAPEVRARLKPLAVFHGGAHIVALAEMLDVEAEAAANLANQIIEVGLAYPADYGHLRLDPALPAYLLRDVTDAEQEELRGRWAETMKVLTNFLYQQRFQDTELAARLTPLELPNLLMMLSWLQDKIAPEELAGLAGRIETLLSRLGLDQALTQVAGLRDQAAQRLTGWSSARFQAEGASIDRLLERGQAQAAYGAAQEILKRAMAAGENAYPNADYDIAMAHLRLGRVLKRVGAVEDSLALLHEAERRFQALADAGNTSAANMASNMASVAVTESGDCLTALGRLDEASAAYEEAIRRDEARGDKRGVAVDKGQLAVVKRMQKQYGEALEIYDEARRIFEALGEPMTVATVWHQMGVVYRSAGQLEQAERAYRQSLAIKVQQKNLAGEATTLGELGILYALWKRLEDAVKCHKQAADIYAKLKAQRDEGLVRNNLAFTLIQMKRYDEARHEILRALECKERYGYAAQPWTTWNLLHNLELASGKPEAAALARQKAIESYLSYRRAGGQNMSPGARFCAAARQATERKGATELGQYFTSLLTEEAPAWGKALLPKLLAILRGERDPALCDDPELDYDDAVELRLLLEELGSA